MLNTLKTRFFFIFLFTTTVVVSQDFPNDREKFVKDFERIMRQNTSDDIRPFVREELMPLLLETSDFPDEYFERMVNTCNKMIEKRLKPHPEVYSYVISIYTLVEQKQPKESYEAWHNALDELLDSRNVRRMRDFIEVSGAFFKEGIIAINPNYEWVYRGGNYKFSYENNPFIHFDDGKLICRTINRSRSKKEEPYTDSVVIDKAQGSYDMLRERWDGNGGILTWEKVGLSKEETFAELTSYLISMKSTNFSCDTVHLTNSYFDFKVSGSLVDRARRGSINRDIELPFPQFQSFESTYEIESFLKNVDYMGGFSLQGDEFVGEGTSDKPAQLTFYRNEKPFLRTASSRVMVTDEKVMSDNCAISLYIGLEDSVYHPGLSFSYVEKDEKVLLQRGNTGISQSPFLNSVHKLNMYVEEITWRKSEPIIHLDYNFSTSQQQRSARFESYDYFDGKLYQKLQGMEKVNPLAALWAYAYKYDQYVLSEGKAASALSKTIQQAKSQLLELSSLGFITYDSENETVVINPKLEHFVKSRSGKKDYDNIVFVSDLRPLRGDDVPQHIANDKRAVAQYKQRIAERNKKRERLERFGEINIGTMELDLFGVDNIPISKSKNTIIFPDNNEVTVKQNRSIYFQGWINTGKWEMNILNGNYSYEKNGFNIFESDVTLFRATPQRREDGKRPIPLKSPLSGIKGEIIVDDVSNRSGEDERFTDYPKLISKEKCRIYYDHKSLHLGSYDRDRFYFEIDPFEMDSLATFDERYLRFSGELTSAGIFPKFREELKLMPDYSLGFSREAPDGGFPFYGTDATYDNKIVLSNNGLQGSGQIDFINSTSISKAFTFLPDSTIGVAQFTNKPRETEVQLPDVDGPDTFISFLPRKKVLKARSNKQEISFFDGEANLRGQTTVTEDGITGGGIMELNGAYLTTEQFRFKRWEMLSDTANFNIMNKYKGEEEGEESNPMSFKTNNVNASVDFEERKGVFKSNDGSSTVEFPENMYICKMDLFTWLMDSDDIEMEKSADEEIEMDSDLDLVGPNFYSIHPKQDSLQFMAPKATFNLEQNTIFCYDTKFIEVGDARIFPDSAKVVIRKRAKMDPLENSKIVANLITKHHTFNRATTKIKARRDYISEGNYPYYDSDSNRYNISVPEIRLDTSYQTVAKGKIERGGGFRLSPEFDFYGEVKIKAADPLLAFSGATRINHDCKSFERNWMSFEAAIDPQNIQIPVKEDMKDLDGNPIAAGIVWRVTDDMDDVRLYPTFLSSQIDKEDPIVISASGFLQYNDDANEFQIGSKEKLLNRGSRGNYISLHKSSCSLNGDGKVDLGMDYGGLGVDAVGVVNYDEASAETRMNLTLKISAPLDDKIMTDVAERIRDVQGLNDADFNSTTLEQAILEWVDRETADKIKSDFTLDRKVKRVPKEMREAFVITGVNLISYNKVKGDEQVGLRTSVDQAAIVNMFDEPVMKYVPLKLFAQQRTDMGDRLGILIDVPGGYLYFIDYDYRKKGIMSILSSDRELNDDIESLKSDKKKEKDFSYEITKSSAYQSQFLRVFK